MIEKKMNSNKHTLVSNALIGMIQEGRLTPGSKIPSEQELCKELDVSHVTVRQAKNTLENKGILYSIGRKGTFVTPSALMSRITVIWQHTDLMHQFAVGYRIILNELETLHHSDMVFRHCSYQAASEESGITPQSLIDEATRTHKAGVLLVGHMPELEDYCLKRKVPTLSVWDTKSDIPSVSHDVESTCRLAITELLNMSINDIAIIGFSRTNQFYTNYNKAHGNKWPDSWLENVPLHVRTRRELEQFGYDAFKRIWQREKKPKGFAVLDDIVFRGVSIAITELNLQPKQDFELISHTNKGSTSFVPFPFTAVEIDPFEYATALGCLLKQIIFNPEIPTKSIKIQPRIVLYTNE